MQAEGLKHVFFTRIQLLVYKKEYFREPKGNISFNKSFGYSSVALGIS